MVNGEKSKIKKLNNKGSSLVVVIIVISFICILGTLLLYLSVMNYQMKSNDYKTRVSFYGAEEPLEELRVQLAVDMSSACEKAYMDVMTSYSSLLTEEMRSTEYIGSVFRQLEDIWNDRTGYVPGGTPDWVAAIKAALHDNSDYHVISGDSGTVECTDASCTCSYHIIVLDVSDRLILDKNTGKATLQGIKVVYTENEFTSVVTTDFCMAVPEYDWSMEGNTNSVPGAGVIVTDRQKIDYEKSVVYLNYTKQ